MKSYILETNGNKREYKPSNGVTFSLEEMQKAVGGYIEVLSIPDTEDVMILNEEGKLLNLDRNNLASKLMEEELFSFDFIAGNVLICHRSMIE